MLPSISRDEAHLRHGGCGQFPGQGDHGLLARPAAEGPWPAGHDAEARPVHQRRPGHDEPVRARRGVRHRRRRRDRPRPGPLRALHRREPDPRLQRHHRLDLLGGARRRAPGRLPRQDRAGDPAHHRRDQAPHQPAGHRRRRRRDHRGRRHRRRHRDPPVPRGHPAVPPRRRPRQRLLRPRHPRAVHRSGREQKTKPTQHSVTELRSRGIQPDVIVVPQRAAPSPAASSARSRTCATCRSRPSSTPPTPATSTRSRSCCTRRASTTSCATSSASTTGDPDLSEWEILVDRIEPPTARCASASSASTSACPTPTCRWSRRSSTAASTTAASVEIDWIQAEEVEGLLAEGRLRDLDGIVIPGGFGERGIEGKIAAAGYAREHDIPCLGLCLGMQVMTIEYARNVLGLAGANSSEFDPTTPHPVIDLMETQRGVTDMGGTMRLGAYVAQLAEGSQVAEAYGSTVVSERHRHRYEFNPTYRARFDESGLLVLGHVARRSPGRVHRAAGPPVLGRHPGPPGVQEPAHPPGAAVPGVRRAPRWPGPRVARPHLFDLDADPPRSVDRARDRGRSPSSASVEVWCAARSSPWSGRTFAVPDGRRRSSATSCTTPARWRWCRCTTTARSSLVRQYRAALDVRAARDPRRQARRARARRTQVTAERELAEEVGLRPAAWSSWPTFHNSPGFCDETVARVPRHRPRRGARRPPGRSRSST